MSDENIDEKLEKAYEDPDTVNLCDDDVKALEKVMGVTTKEKSDEAPEKEEKKEPEKKDSPSLMTEDFREKMYDTSPLTGFPDEGVIAGIEDVVEITDSDKNNFLKALLTDENVILDIPLCDGKVIFTIRSKNSWEQNLIYEAAISDREEDEPLDFYQGMLQLQKYGAMVQVQTINKKVFSTLKFSAPKNDWKEQVAELKKQKDEILETMDSTKLTMILNALRMFEYKVAKMSSSCNSGDFWKPAG